MLTRKYPHLTLIASIMLLLAAIIVAAPHQGAADLTTIASVLGAIIAAIGFANASYEIEQKKTQQ